MLREAFAVFLLKLIFYSLLFYCNMCVFILVISMSSITKRRPLRRTDGEVRLGKPPIIVIIIIIIDFILEQTKQQFFMQMTFS